MLKMEDSGIDSDSKSNGFVPIVAECNSSLLQNKYTSSEDPHCVVKFSDSNDSNKCFQSTSDDSSQINEHSGGTPTKIMTTSQLQKRLEKQILHAKKIRQKEQNVIVDAPKKLISRNRLKVPKANEVPIVTKADSCPLVSWESESEDEEFNFLSSRNSRDVTEQLIKDGYSLDLVPDDEDLDLIPPKPFKPRCMCCNTNHSCVIL